MRCLHSRVKYICYLATINGLLVVLAIRYLTCKSFQSSAIKFDEKFFIKERESSFKSRCKPHKNIVFLKTHKTGSSTITNILNRYGEANALTFILPRLGENRLDWPWFFQDDSFYPLNGSTPNILNNHARYHRDVMQAIMPNDTYYVTILRHPITQFESTFSYMTLDKILGMRNSTDPLEEFFKAPERVLVNYVLTQDLRINSDRLKLIRNGMFYDLGLESKDFENDDKIQETIHELDRQFDLVMMTEYFEESLVLLKRLMCWHLDDVVFFRMKQRAQSFRRNISFTLKRKISHWSRADVRLYQHFNRTFWTVLNSMNKDFWDEVKLLKAKNKAMEDLCLRRVHHVSSELIQTAETKQFTLRSNIPRDAKEMCMRMTWDEIKYLKYLREVHIEKMESKYKSFFNSLRWLTNKIRHL